jgi:cell division protein FtsB
LLEWNVRLKKEDQKNFQLFLFFISLLLIALLAVSNWKIEAKRKDLKKEIENLTSQLQILKKRNEELKEAISKAKSESYWEEKAREEGYLKEGEEAIVIKKMEEEEKKKPETIWQRIINFFQK